jgi:hypothetical protein
MPWLSDWSNQFWKHSKKVSMLGPWWTSMFRMGTTTGADCLSCCWAERTWVWIWSSNYRTPVDNLWTTFLEAKARKRWLKKKCTHCSSQSEPPDSTRTLHVQPFGKGVSCGSTTRTLSLTCVNEINDFRYARKESWRMQTWSYMKDRKNWSNWDSSEGSGMEWEACRRNGDDENIAILRRLLPKEPRM